MKEIKVRELIGTNVNHEDAVILKQMIEEHLDDSIILDFENIKDLSCGFFATILTELFCMKGRDYVLSHLTVKSLTNLKAFNMVAYGTAFA